MWRETTFKVYLKLTLVFKGNYWLTFRTAGAHKYIVNDVMATKAWESWIGLAYNNSFRIVQTWQLRLHTQTTNNDSHVAN